MEGKRACHWATAMIQVRYLCGHRKRIVIAGREGERDLETLDLGEVTL